MKHRISGVLAMLKGHPYCLDRRTEVLLLESPDDTEAGAGHA